MPVPQGSLPCVGAHWAGLTEAPGYWYLATPYSRYPLGIEAAFRAACRIAGRLIRAGVPVFSPIAHSHPIAKMAGIDPYAHDVWLPADAPLMRAAHGLLVAQLDGWDESVGVAHEIEAFCAAGKPTLRLFIEPEDLA